MTCKSRLLPMIFLVGDNSKTTVAYRISRTSSSHQFPMEQEFGPTQRFAFSSQTLRAAVTTMRRRERPPLTTAILAILKDRVRPSQSLQLRLIAA